MGSSILCSCLDELICAFQPRLFTLFPGLRRSTTILGWGLRSLFSLSQLDHFHHPCRILWTLQFCVLCPSHVGPSFTSHSQSLGDSHQRNVMRFWCLSYLVISCHILSYLVISCYLGIFLFFWSPLDITWWSSPHLCYAGLPDWPQTILLDIERYPEIRLCHVCKIHVQYVQYVHFTHFMYVAWGWVEWVESTHDSTPVISQTWSRTHGLRSGFTRVFWSFSYDLGDCTCDVWSCVTSGQKWT